MKTFAILFCSLVLTACASGGAKKSQEFNSTCGPTPVMESDLTEFGLKPQPGKVAVVRIFASWCPYCKADLDRMAAKFASGEWKPENIHVYLIAYKNHSENKTTFDKFVKDKLPAYKFPAGTIELVYADEAFPELSKKRNASGATLFDGWRGVPFALVFGKDQRLAFRGHFTTSPDSEDKHYKYIGQLQAETCR